MTLNTVDLVYVVVVGIALILSFFVQKMLDPTNYFGIGELLYGSKSLTPKALLIKMGYIFLVSIVFYVLGLNRNIIILGIGIGSFLLVWPAILYPETLEWWTSGPRRLRKFLYLFYFIFIVISIIMPFLAVLMVDFIKGLFVGVLPTPYAVMRYVIGCAVSGILINILHKIGKHINYVLETKIR